MPGDLFPADWLVTFEYADTQLGTLKSGKESEVHLVARTSRGRTSLLAEKRFKALDRRMFKATYRYAGVWGEGTYREDRAMKKNTRYGQEARYDRWIANEWTNLVHLYDAGVTVPPPVGLLDAGYLMAFIGDGYVAAPRLEAVDLDQRTAARVWNDLVGELATMLDAERVHGDLSAYNVLWWHDRAVLIDFSQTVEIVTHPAALELLRRDVTSLARYFTHRGVVIDVDDVLARIGADTHRFASQLQQAPYRPRKRAKLDTRVE
jgi:RIO kinase 1